MRLIDFIMLTITALAAAVTLPIFGKEHSVDFGNTSDIVSAGANICMAGAAVYAAVNAKQWFSQRSHTKGFDKAENILSTIDSYYRDRNNYLSKLHSTFEFLNALDSHLTVASETSLDKYEALSRKHADNIVLIDKLSDELELIERWSITVVNHELINSVIKALRALNASASNTYNCSRSCIYNLNYMHKEDFDITFKHFKSQYTDFLKDLATLDDCYEKFKKQKFTSFFRVN